METERVYQHSDVCYHFRVLVKYKNGKSGVETYKVSESATEFGQAVATGKVVRFYDELRDSKEITDYRILE